MLGTDVKPQARFKAVRTVLKPSGPLQSRRDGFKTVVARFTRFRAVQPDGFASVCGACVAPYVGNIPMQSGTRKRWDPCLIPSTL